MDDPTIPGSYIEAVTIEDERLKATLAAIHADEDAGNLTAVEAAGNRVSAQEAHLARCRELRAEWFGGDDVARDHE